MSTTMFYTRLIRAILVAPLAVVLVSCASREGTIPAGTVNPDQFLMGRANAAAADGDWLDARELFQQLVDGFPQSPLRVDARLGLANSLLEQGSAESLVLAAAEYQDFLRFYPTSIRADEAQLGLASTHFEQMRPPERDQTETRAALAEFEQFLASYPDSPLVEEAQIRWRETRDRLSDAAYQVGFYYYRTGWLPGAIDRFEQVLAEDPNFTRRDAVYFYLADSLVRSDNRDEAISYLQRLLAEFDVSEHRQGADLRLEELTAQ
jgi:outer membrane protein assembly factor BamD